MSRHGRNSSYGHRIKRFAADHFRLSWTVDRYYDGSQLRYPRRCTRDTDEAGALRFAKRWGVSMPAATPPTAAEGQP